ncbi:MAG: NAD(P)-dependent oxidoreductase [Bdellovibrionota bacterium]
MPYIDDAPIVTVFGGAGYIGCILTRMLLDEGYRVRVVDNFLFGDHGIRFLAESPLLEIIEGDITDTKTVSTAINGAETVILLAAIVGHRIADLHGLDPRPVNLLASSVVLDASIEHGVNRFLFASTNSVYGVQSGVMYETTIPEPVSLYSRLKLRMEERVINSKRRSFHPTALRIATCHGYSPRMRFDLVANSLMRDAVFKKEIRIASGEQWRALIHVEDTARAFLSCIKAHVNLVSGEIFNVGCRDQNVQINHLANIVKTLVPDTNITFYESDPDLVDYHLSCSRIEKILDFEPRWTIEKSMEELRDYLLSGRIGDPFSFQFQNT